MSAESFSHGERVGVRKAYKIFIGGQFVRSESGRYLQVARNASNGAEHDMENIPRASRKDAREAVKAAHGAAGGWAKRTAFNRGQILYRLAEMMEGRRAELERSLADGGTDNAKHEVDAAIDRVIAYAGWTDKFYSVMSSYNPVAGPHFDFTVPEPMGVVAAVAPPRPALLGLVGCTAPIIAAGNTCVTVASESDPRTALIFCELLATSDLPAGVVNILTGHVSELLPHLAKHMDVNGLDLHNVDAELVKAAEMDAAETVKRARSRRLSAEAWFDGPACETPRWIERFVEMKTVWHPAGS